MEKREIESLEALAERIADPDAKIMFLYRLCLAKVMMGLASADDLLAMKPAVMKINFWDRDYFLRNARFFPDGTDPEPTKWEFFFGGALMRPTHFDCHEAVRTYLRKDTPGEIHDQLIEKLWAETDRTS